MIWLQAGDGAIPIQQGQALSDGLTVEEISAQNVRLRHWPSGTEIDVPVPPPPEGGTAW